MKHLTLAFILTIVSSWACLANDDINSPTIEVRCNCYFRNSRGIESTYIAIGLHSATTEDLSSCHIDDGHLVHQDGEASCLPAIEDAFFNCENNVNAFRNPYESRKIRIPVRIDILSCRGIIHNLRQDPESETVIMTHLSSQ